MAAITPAGASQGVWSPATRMVDFGGRCVIPGLWDEHVHMTQWALASNRLDLSGAGSAREAAAVVGSWTRSASRRSAFQAARRNG